MFNFDHLDANALGDVARNAFVLGLYHGNKFSGPWTADEVWQHLDLGAFEFRRGHKTKIRQVYGAGFDIAAMMRRVHSKEEARC